MKFNADIKLLLVRAYLMAMTNSILGNWPYALVQVPNLYFNYKFNYYFVYVGHSCIFPKSIET